MVTKMRVEWNRKAFREIRMLKSVQDELNRRGERVAQAAGPGFESDPGDRARTRARTTVYPATPEAARENAKNNVLLKALRRST